MKSLRVLLQGSIDYAGLFPPANLDLATAVGNYAAYHNGEAAWALGRFLLPAARLPAFAAIAAPLLPDDPDQPWRLSALVSNDLAADAAQILQFNAHHARCGALVDTVEIKASDAGEIRHARRVLPAPLRLYVELPPDASHDVIMELGVLGARAKIRTGGVAAAAFPSSAELVRFITSCVKARVPFKATAGLHHPLRSVQRLTYETGSPTALMHGFLNLFLATAFVDAGMGFDAVVEVLEERAPDAFRFDDAGVTWKAHRLDNVQLEQVRRGVVRAFGSCSFCEPLDELKAINLI